MGLLIFIACGAGAALPALGLAYAIYLWEAQVGADKELIKGGKAKCEKESK